VSVRYRSLLCWRSMAVRRRAIGVATESTHSYRHCRTLFRACVPDRILRRTGHSGSREQLTWRRRNAYWNLGTSFALSQWSNRPCYEWPGVVILMACVAVKRDLLVDLRQWVTRSCCGQLTVSLYCSEPERFGCR
jgi:hypothetical protein